MKKIIFHPEGVIVWSRKISTSTLIKVGLNDISPLVSSFTLVRALVSLFSPEL